LHGFNEGIKEASSLNYKEIVDLSASLATLRRDAIKIKLSKIKEKHDYRITKIVPFNIVKKIIYAKAIL